MKHPSQIERRGLTRHAISLSVDLGGIPGTTLNVSPRGVLFESSARTEIGAAIDFRLDPGAGATGMLPLRCRGRVVRTSPIPSGMRVAATIDWIEHEC